MSDNDEKYGRADDAMLWERYEMHIELYKFYMSFILKINIFYYGITGAILSYYFTNKANGTAQEFVLLLPIAISIALCLLFSFAHKTYPIAVDDIEDIAKQLGLYRWVRTDAFTLITKGSSVLMLIISITLIGVLLCKTL